MKAGEQFRTDIARNAASCKAFLMLINEAWFQYRLFYLFFTFSFKVQISGMYV